MNFKSLLTIALAATISVSAFAQRSQYYCNPLPMPIGNSGNATGDVSVIEYNGLYYMYCTGGGVWTSTDFVNWDHHDVDVKFPVAPDVCEFNGKFYMTGNSDHIFEANSPLGPFRDLGEFKFTGTRADGWHDGFDCKIFVDDDNQPYLYWCGYSISGIFAVRLDPKDMTRFMDMPTHLMGFNPLHPWERYGEANEYPGVGWIEGPWVFKRNGIYYLEYSASGTQWQSYAHGYYTATSPLGPYTYAPNNPLTRNMQGLVTGTGHGSIAKGPDGNYWQFYTVVLPTPTGWNRRIGMDKITFDSDGLMYCTVTDTPQPGPLAKVDPDAKKIYPLSIHKMTASENRSKISSNGVGSFSSYLVDNFAGTIWFAAEDDKQPTITIDLSPATEFDKVHYYAVDSFRILFNPARRMRGVAGELPVYKYKVETSKDGEHFTTVLDKSGNTVPKETIFDTFEPSVCKFVRFTILDWPKSSPLGIIDLTVFGTPDVYDDERVSIPNYFNQLPKF